MGRKWRQNDHFLGIFLSLGEVFGILQILVRSMRASINKWGVFGIFTHIILRGGRVMMTPLRRATIQSRGRGRQ